MAYIPDEAIYDSSSLTDSAFKIYCLLCARRNHKSERTFCAAQTVVRLLGISKATYYRSIKELEAMAWIERKGSVYGLLKGDFTPMNNRSNGSLSRETKSLKNETAKSQPRDSRNIYHDSFTSDKPYVLEASGATIDQMHEEDATNAACPWCRNAGVIRMKSGELRTCRCQPELFEAQRP